MSALASDTLPSPEAQRWLLRLARCELARSIGAPAVDPGPRPADPSLERPARVFVSWHDRGELVGCIGTLSRSEPLAQAVAHYAVAAGDDPRTPPLRAARVAALDCDISVLGEPHPLAAVGFDAIAQALVPGRDGVVLRDEQGRSAFFLPVVWESLASPRDFLTALARKAGIDLARARTQLRAEVLEVAAFSAPGSASP